MQPITFASCPTSMLNQEPMPSPHGMIDDMPFVHRKALMPVSATAQTHYQRGLAFRADNKIAEALNSFHQAARLQPQFVQVHIALGETHANSGDYANAVVSLRRALVLAPAMWSLHADMGANLRAMGRWGEAALSFRRAIAQQPENLHLYIGLVQVLGAQGRVNEARKCLECANARVPVTTSALQTLSAAREALRFLEKEVFQKLQTGIFPV